MNNLLPLGTVIKTADGIKMMIIGYAPISNDKTYLYSAVVYPTGMMYGNNIIVIDKDCEFEVCSTGYTNDDIQDFLRGINKIIDDYD